MVEEFNNDLRVNGKITADVMESPNITALAEELSLVYKKAYPVGSIYMSTSPTSPAELFGGDWEEYAKGRVLVGLDTTMIDANTYTNPEFNAVEKTGGTKTHTLTIDEIPNHQHRILSGTYAAGSDQVLNVDAPRGYRAGDDMGTSNVGGGGRILIYNPTLRSEFGVGQTNIHRR